ncbi:MAG: carbohydrate ABC transporter permease [Planctomycetota bacterium]
MSRGAPGQQGGPGVVTYGLLAVASIAVVVPLLYLVASAFKAEADFLESLFLPRGEGFAGIAWDRLTLSQFEKLLGDDIGLGRAMLNSLFLSSVTSIIATLTCAAAGYALVVYRFRGRSALDWVVIAALVIPPPLLIAPSYQWLYRLGLLDSYWGVILPAAAPAFGVFLFRQASLQSVPKSMIEAARLDGAGELSIFLGIGLPMLRPMVGAFLMITFLAMWNNFIGPQIVLQTATKQPLSVVMYLTQTSYYNDYGLMMAGTLVSVVPVVVVFLVLQREFISGLTAGAVKGE